MKYVGLLMVVLGLLPWVPFLGLVFEMDPQVVQEAANSRIEQIVASLPWRIAASVVGFFAPPILFAAKDLFKRM